MNIFYVVEDARAEGANSRVSIIESRTDENNAVVPQGVVFAVRSKNLAQCEAVAAAIVDIHNIWISSVHGHQVADGNSVMPYTPWIPSDAKVPPGSEYVYVYSTPDDQNELNQQNIFYIGRGIKSRWLQHVRGANRFLVNENDLNPLDRLKLIKINEALSSAEPSQINLPLRVKKNWARKNLVRQIAHFTNQNARERSEAVEHFLINYWIGVFELTNKTRGNDTYNTVNWISCPKGTRETVAWGEIVAIFASGERVTQGPKRGLLKEELNSVPDGIMFDRPVFISRNSPTTQLVPPQNIQFKTNKTDVYFEYLVQKNSSDYLKLRLKMGNQDLGAVINILPLDGDHANFEQKVADTFFGGNTETAHRFIRNPGTGAYFKPCASVPAGGINQVDVPFDLRDPVNYRGTIQSDAPLLREQNDGNSWSASLNEVLQKIIDKVAGGPD